MSEANSLFGEISFDVSAVLIWIRSKIGVLRGQCLT